MALWTANTPPKYLANTGTFYNVKDCKGVPAAVAVTNKEDAGWVQVFTAPGGIASVSVTAAGSGYTNGASVPLTITGSGTGATATAAVVNGAVTAVTVTAAGSGYYPNTVVTISDGSGTGATFAAKTSGRVRQETLVAMSTVTANGFVSNV